MEYKNKLILVEKPRKNVALITLSNPPLNLVTLDLSAELRETLFKLEQDDEVRVIVLTGSGQRAFCVGSDVKEFPQVWDDVIGKKLQKENETFNCIEFLEKPVIAAMEGTVCGGGYEMAMACDLRIMSDISKIAQPEINLGVFPGSGGLFRLPRIVGAAKAIVEIGGAKEVYACASHGVLSGPAIERIENSCIKELLLLDTIPYPENAQPCDKIKYMSVAPVFAEAIQRVYEEISISNLFE